MNFQLFDVTEKTQTDNPDDETCPLLRCVCGKTYERWTMTISIYEDLAQEMPCCGRRLIFRNDVRVLEVR